MTFIVKAITASGMAVSVVVSATGKKTASKLATPLLYQEIDSRIMTREVIRLG
jgi:hypothetical protein